MFFFGAGAAAYDDGGGFDNDDIGVGESFVYMTLTNYYTYLLKNTTTLTIP